MADVPGKVDLIWLLSSAASRDFLIRNDEAKVSINKLRSKIIGLYFCGRPSTAFTGTLIRVYNQLVNQIEIVYVPLDSDEESFRSHFSEMPWLSFSSYNADAVNRLHRTFQVVQYPYLVFVDGDGNVSENDWINIVQDYGSEAYPFTAERFNRLQEEDRVGKENITIRSIVDSTYLTSREGNLITVDALERKTVGLFVSAGWTMLSPEHVEFTQKLIDLYNELNKEGGDKFEIVTIYGDDDIKAFPWLTPPCKGNTCRKLIRYYKSFTPPMVLIFGSDGKPLHQDHVFTPEKLALLEQTVKASAGSDLTSSPYRIRFNIRDKEIEKDQKVHFLKILIATKGYPCSGKSTIADAIAKSLRCTVIRIDEILASFCTYVDSTKLAPKERRYLYDLAFGTACNLAVDQLHLNRPVVIDSPLALPAHLDRFTQVATISECKMVVIVECKRRYTTWLRTRSWKDWDEFAVSKNEREPFPALENTNRLPIAVSRLDVDTTSESLPLDFAGLAIRDLTYRGKAHRAELTNWSYLKPLHQALLEDNSWKYRPEFNPDPSTGRRTGDLAQKHRVPPTTESGYETGQNTENICCSDGHFIAKFREKGLHYEANCSVCWQLIGNGPAYTCVHCRTALHKSCAEWDREKAMIAPNKLPSYLRKGSNYFADVYPCPVCVEQPLDPYGRRKSRYKCESCLYETHFRARKIPTIVYHEYHTRPVKAGGHFLAFWVTPNDSKYICSACGRPGKIVGYVCNSCPGCYFHVECVLLPRPGINVHGGYRHAMEMVVDCEDDHLDERICRECWKPRKPGGWFYYCEECDYPVHTYCFKFTEDN